MLEFFGRAARRAGMWLFVVALGAGVPGAAVSKPAPSPSATCRAGQCACLRVAATAQPEIDAAAAARELRITYYGVSTLMFSDGQNRLLVDGFFTRPAAWRLPLLPIDSDTDAVNRGLGDDATKVLAVLTAHAHHDHALDTATVAKTQKQAVVVGTPSVARLVQARETPVEQVCVPTNGQQMRFGPYKVTAMYVEHGPAVFFLRWILDHPLKRDLTGPAWFGSYKDDDNLSFLVEHGGRRILIHPSSGPLEAPIEAETVLLGIGRVGRMSPKESLDYWNGTVSPQTTTVVPIHWDQFTTKVGEPLIDSTRLLDDVEKARKRVCRYAAARSGTQLIWLGSKQQLIMPPGSRPRGPDKPPKTCDPSGAATSASRD